MTRNRPRGFEAGKPDAGVAWADALRGAVAVATAAWSPRRGRALHVAVAFGDEAGGRFGEEGGGRRDVFERLIQAFADFRSCPRPTSYHVECVQCHGATTGSGSSPSEECATEWKDEGATCSWIPHVPSVVERSVSVGA